MLTVVAGIGILRFPDFYTRLHAASITDTLGTFVMLAGFAIMAPSLLVLFKLLMIAVFLILTGPTSTHAVANAAATAGLEPLTGRVRAKTDGPLDGAAEDSH